MIVSEGRGRPIRRILVAVDASADSLAAVEAAARLAAELGAEIAGLFVEDVNLIRLSGHPAARQVDAISGESRPLEPGELARQLRNQATAARRRLAEIAERRGVAWSFRTARGRVALELLTRAADVDLITLGATSMSLTRVPGSTVRAVVAEARGPVLVLRRGAALGSARYVLYDGTPAAARALELGAAMARDPGTKLVVALLGDEARRERSAREVRDWLEGHGRGAELLHLDAPASGAAALAEFVRRRGCGLMIVPAQLLAGDREALRTVLWRARCPVLLVP